MSRRPNIYDHAMAGSFRKTHKNGEVCLHEYRTIYDVIDGTTQFNDDVHNRQGLHSWLDHSSPVQFESRTIIEAT